MEKFNFLPGPVNIHADTLACFAEVPISHRCGEFESLLADTRARLKNLVNTNECAVFTGSGTLANDVIGAQLSLQKERGLVLSNGEFGERLAAQAERFSLKFSHLKYPWGAHFDYDEIRKYFEAHHPAWIWFAHFETSTCVLNDIKKLCAIAKEYGAKVCVDAVSSIGNMELDLSEVNLASASSGKGLACLAGLSFVFSNRAPKSAERLPKYLDMGFSLENGGLPFTISSNHVAALNAELVRMNLQARMSATKKISARLKEFSGQIGFKIIGAEDFMLTFEMPPASDSLKFGDYLAARGVAIHYKNAYLARRNWVQLALMGYPSERGAERFIDIADSFFAKNIQKNS